MGQPKSHDLKISGSMILPGGHFKNVYISGRLELNGDTLVDNEYKVSGSGKVNGNLKISKGSISGRVDVDGGVESDDLTVWGHLSISGNLSSKNLSIKGRTETEGTVKADTVNTYGEFIISKDCNAEEFYSKGIVKIEGMLNSGIIDMRLLYSKSRIKEIGGEKITVKREPDNKFLNALKSLFVPGEIFGGRLTADVIEGDEVYIEQTKAKVVRGNSVTIGPDCEIDTVEYKTVITVDVTALVKEQRKI
jgi:cytoskeletal protein CcmA (bactofilin family)